MIVELHRRSNGAFALAEGTIYPALHRLEREGLLTSSWDKVDGRRRRVYSLTRAGRRVLSDRKAIWRRFARGMSAVLEGS